MYIKIVNHIASKLYSKTVKNVRVDIQKDEQIVKGDRLHFLPSGAWEKADIVNNKHTFYHSWFGL